METGSLFSGEDLVGKVVDDKSLHRNSPGYKKQRENQTRHCVVWVSSVSCCVRIWKIDSTQRGETVKLWEVWVWWSLGRNAFGLG